MNSLRTRQWLAAYVATALLAALANAQTTIHVDDDAPTGGDGLTWPAAHRYLQDALAHAALLTPPVEIRVAQGTYTPDVDEAGNVTPLDREVSFQLLDGVSLLGGYPGFDTQDPDARNSDLFDDTILSADLAGDDAPGFVNIDDNGWHVVDGSGVNATALIEGFAITGGYAWGPFGPPTYDSEGGGMLNVAGSPTVRQCIFAWNRAAAAGAGMGNFGSSPHVTDCLFENNWVEPSAQAGGGGGMISIFGGQPQISGCTFRSNTADFGAGVNNSMLDQLTVTNCTFDDNEARAWGGGMVVHTCTDVTITSSTFVGNTTTDRGGGMALDSSNAMLVDCTFAGQNAADWGGGMFMARGQATIINTRFTENHADRGGGAIHAVDSADPVLANCTFIGNDAVDYGGALNNGWPGYAANHADVRSCTFIGNSAAGGGAIRLAGTSELVVSNSIIWGNTSQIAEDGSVLPVVDYCDVQGGHTGTGNIDADPMCVDGRPQADSPCLDAGDSNALPADVADLDDDGNTTEPLPLDLDGNPRAADDPGAPGTGTGGCPIVDMGAFERPGGTIGCCAADVTGPAGVPDDNVDALDYLLLIAQWGSPCTGSCEADITGPAGAPDGNVDALDYLMLIAQWSSPADCH